MRLRDPELPVRCASDSWRLSSQSECTERRPVKRFRINVKPSAWGEESKSHLVVAEDECSLSEGRVGTESSVCKRGVQPTCRAILLQFSTIFVHHFFNLLSVGVTSNINESVS